MHIKLTREQQRFWKRLFVDDYNDITTTFKAAIEYWNDANKRIEVYTANDPV
jgi:hypothetical protein